MCCWLWVDLDHSRAVLPREVGEAGRRVDQRRRADRKEDVAIGRGRTGRVERVFGNCFTEPDDARTQVAAALRAHGDGRRVVGHLRRAVAEAGPDLPILDVTTLCFQIDRSLRSDKLISRLTSFFGLTALLLASIGLYGVMAYGVAQRTNEIGVRIALGAGQFQVLWMILRDSMSLVGLGILIGIPAALAATRVTSSVLFGLDTVDPATMVGATLLLCAVAALAGYLPARRASRLDPSKSLRYE